HVAPLERVVRLYDAVTGLARFSDVGHTALIRAVAFHPGGRLLASASKDGTVKLWDLASGKEVLSLEGDASGWARGLAFAPGGRMLASVGSDRTIRLWDAMVGRCLRTLTGHTEDIEAVAFSPDGRTLASAGMDRTVRLWEVDTGTGLGVL